MRHLETAHPLRVPFSFKTVTENHFADKIIHISFCDRNRCITELNRRLYLLMALKPLTAWISFDSFFLKAKRLRENTIDFEQISRLKNIICYTKHLSFPF